MTKRVAIRNYDLPKHPRVFDVVVTEEGDIIRFEIKNIKGTLYINAEEIHRQISEALTA